MSDTETKPNPSDFSINARPREYTARIEVRGTISMSLKADSKEDAQRQAEAEVEKIETEGYVEIDSIDQIEVDYIYKDAPMFLVTREGKKMQTTHLQAGDEPRQPDERGW